MGLKNYTNDSLTRYVGQIKSQNRVLGLIKVTINN